MSNDESSVFKLLYNSFDIKDNVEKVPLKIVTDGNYTAYIIEGKKKVNYFENSFIKGDESKPKILTLDLKEQPIDILLYSYCKNGKMSSYLAMLQSKSIKYLCLTNGKVLQSEFPNSVSSQAVKGFYSIKNGNFIIVTSSRIFIFANEEYKLIYEDNNIVIQKFIAIFSENMCVISLSHKNGYRFLAFDILTCKLITTLNTSDGELYKIIGIPNCSVSGISSLYLQKNSVYISLLVNSKGKYIFNILTFILDCPFLTSITKFENVLPNSGSCFFSINKFMYISSDNKLIFSEYSATINRYTLYDDIQLIDSKMCTGYFDSTSLSILFVVKNRITYLYFDRKNLIEKLKNIDYNDVLKVIKLVFLLKGNESLRVDYLDLLLEKVKDFSKVHEISSYINEIKELYPYFNIREVFINIVRTHERSDFIYKALELFLEISSNFDIGKDMLMFNMIISHRDYLDKRKYGEFFIRYFSIVPELKESFAQLCENYYFAFEYFYSKGQIISCLDICSYFLHDDCLREDVSKNLYNVFFSSLDNPNALNWLLVKLKSSDRYVNAENLIKSTETFKVCDYIKLFNHLDILVEACHDLVRNNESFNSKGLLDCIHQIIKEKDNVSISERCVSLLIYNSFKEFPQDKMAILIRNIVNKRLIENRNLYFRIGMLLISKSPKDNFQLCAVLLANSGNHTFLIKYLKENSISKFFDLSECLLINSSIYTDILNEFGSLKFEKFYRLMKLNPSFVGQVFLNTISNRKTISLAKNCLVYNKNGVNFVYRVFKKMLTISLKHETKELTNNFVHFLDELNVSVPFVRFLCEYYRCDVYSFVTNLTNTSKVIEKILIEYNILDCVAHTAEGEADNIVMFFLSETFLFSERIYTEKQFNKSCKYVKNFLRNNLNIDLRYIHIKMIESMAISMYNALNCRKDNNTFCVLIERLKELSIIFPDLCPDIILILTEKFADIEFKYIKQVIDYINNYIKASGHFIELLICPDYDESRLLISKKYILSEEIYTFDNLMYALAKNS